MTGFYNNTGRATGFAGVDEDGYPSGDLTGSYPNPTVKGIWDNPIDPRLPNDGDTLIFNGGEWIPTPSPASTTIFQGVWDANANSPDISNYPGLSDGYVWIVGTAGTTNVGGISTWDIGDYAVYSGGNWYRLSNSAFGWRLAGNTGTNPTVNYVGTSDSHDLSLRANAVEGLRIHVTGDITAAQSLAVLNSIVVTQNITGSNALLSGDLRLDGGNLTTTTSTFNLLNSNAQTVNFAGGATTGILAGNSLGTNTFSGPTRFPQGISGSLTKLVDGTSAFIEGVGIVVTSASNGAVTFTMSNTGSAGTYGTAAQIPVFSTDAQGRVNSVTNTPVQIAESQVTNLLTDLTASSNALAAVSSSLAAEKANKVTSIFAGLGLNGGGNLSADRTLSINDSVVATISGSTFTGAVKFNAGMSGSLTKLADGTSYLIGGNNISVTSASNGPVTVAFSTPTAPASSDVLVYNGTTWAPSSIISTLQTSYQTVIASEAIAAGDVCYIVNSGGSGANPTVARAQANSISTIRGVIGLATTAIAKNATGTVQTYGQLVGPVTTNNFAQGSPLFVSETVPGGVTDVKPQGPNFAFQIGIVTRQGQPQNVTSGIVFISPIMQTDTHNIDNIIHTNAAVNDVLLCTTPAAAAGGGIPALPPVYSSTQLTRLYYTNTPYSVSAGTQIPSSAFDTTGSKVIYLPLTSGNSTITLASPKPIVDLTASDYGRQLWLHNVGNANITIPRAGGGNRNVALDGGVSLTLTPGTLVKLMWINPGSGQAYWLQTDKAITAT